MYVYPISFAINNSFKSNKLKPQNKVTNEENIKNTGLSLSASDALKAQVLYQQSKNDTEYLSYGLSNKEIKKALKDKNKMGRVFDKKKRKKVATIITEAKDSKLAIDNFNILMNAKNKKMPSDDVVDILEASTNINNNTTNKESEADEYGFRGGHLDDKTIDSIINQIHLERDQLLAIEIEMNQELQEDNKKMLQFALDCAYMDNLAQMDSAGYQYA